LRLAGLGLLLWLPQIVQAISLAAARSANDEVKIALAAAEDRLQNYARVHQALRVPEHGSLIDASTYLRQLCRAISRSRLDVKSVDWASCTHWFCMAEQDLAAELEFDNPELSEWAVARTRHRRRRRRFRFSDFRFEAAAATLSGAGSASPRPDRNSWLRGWRFPYPSTIRARARVF
jgi:histidine kinase